MKVVLITQDDPFYLGRNIDYLLSILPTGITVTGCVMFDVSPFGKRESFTKKLKKTFDIFGANFTFRYGLKFIKSKFDKESKLRYVLHKHRVPLIKLEKSINHSDSLQIIKQYQPDVLVSIAGNQIFKKPLITLAQKGCINLHTALLPKYRGLMPSFWVLRNNEKFTGVSVFFVDEGIDSGPIIIQKKVAIGDMSQQKLIETTKKIGMDAIIEALVRIKNNDVELIPNRQEEMSYYSFPTREDVKEFRRIGKNFF